MFVIIRVGEISLLKDLIKTMEIRAREERKEDAENPPQGTTETEQRQQLLASGILHLPNLWPPAHSAGSVDSSSTLPGRPTQRHHQGPSATMRAKNTAVPPHSKMNGADFRKEAELAKHKNERKLAREERVKTLSETLIRKLNQLTDTDMDEKAIRAFQLKLQVPELFSHPPSHGLIHGNTDELLPHNGTGRSREP